jgi:thiosulfate dehydrogenase
MTRLLQYGIGPILLAGLYGITALMIPACNNKPDVQSLAQTEEAPWQGWNRYQIKPEDTLVSYGYELISNTSYYLGPKGKVAPLTNGMNCQNCHLGAGTLPYGNNYSAVVANYPMFRARSGGIETIPKRVNDCMERSLNGKALDTNSKEMKAIVAYMHWVGDEIPAKTKPRGSGIPDLKPLDRPADPAKGELVYTQQCKVCHGANGEGQPNAEGFGYVYPPVWGKSSYNVGAGLYRLSRLAGFVKYNMPFGTASYKNQILTDEQSWDVAAYINSMPRPTKDLSNDWPDISKKPRDHPFGPYADSLSEQQHKYGPWPKAR